MFEISFSPPDITAAESCRRLRVFCSKPNNARTECVLKTQYACSGSEQIDKYFEMNGEFKKSIFLLLLRPFFYTEFLKYFYFFLNYSVQRLNRT